MSIDKGGPAFPRPAGSNGVPHVADRWEKNAEVGTSLRDWFAGQALPQIIAINDKVTAGQRDVPYSVACDAPPNMFTR